MESVRGSTEQRYGPAASATSLFRPPVKFQIHRPFEDCASVMSRDTPTTDQFASYLQYPDIHSTGLPLLLPPAQHPLGGAFHSLYHHQKMHAVDTLTSQVNTSHSMDVCFRAGYNQETCNS